MLTLRMLLVVAAAVTTANAACLSLDWKQYRDKCYWFSNGTEMTWYDANAICPVLFPDAEMVSIHDLDLDAFIGEDLLGGALQPLHRGGRCGHGGGRTLRRAA